MSLKNSSDTIGNRTRDLPVCSVVLNRYATVRPRSVIYASKFSPERYENIYSHGIADNADGAGIVYHENCEAWSLTLREERRLKVFENSVLRRVFGSRRDEVTGEWRKLHNEEPNDLYTLPNIVRVVKSRRMRWPWYVALMLEGRAVHRVLVGKPEGRRSLGRDRRRWEDNIKMDLHEVGGGCGDWMERAQVRDKWRALVIRVMIFRVP
jgi:hypothetical protein